MENQKKFIGGVCLYLSQKFGLDPTLVRVLMVIAFFFFNIITVVVYLIIWFGIRDQQSAIAGNTSYTPDELVELNKRSDKKVIRNLLQVGGTVLGAAVGFFLMGVVFNLSFELFPSKGSGDGVLQAIGSFIIGIPLMLLGAIVGFFLGRLLGVIISK